MSAFGRFQPSHLPDFDESKYDFKASSVRFFCVLIIKPMNACHSTLMILFLCIRANVIRYMSAIADLHLK